MNDGFPHPTVVASLRSKGTGYQYNVDSRVRSITQEIARRAPESWWARAAAVVQAEGHATGNPLGDGVDWFMQDDPYWLFPPEMRAEVAEDATEAAREVILAAMDHAVAVMRPVALALAAIGAQ